jgi:hypothetical protein
MIRRIARFAGTRLIRLADTGLDRRPETVFRPSILMVSIPKSGTVYLNKMFVNGLGLTPCIMSNQYFPHDQLYLDAMEKFARGGFYLSAHINPSTENLQILDVFVPKWVVHFRDPRSVLLSWVYHVARLASETRFTDLLRVTPTPPRALHTWTFEKRVDWHVENFLPTVNQWMLDWLTIASQMSNRILITEFATLKEREQDHAGMILDFLGTDRSSYRHRPPEKTMESHFRSASYDEWREAFTPSQVKRVNGMIPPLLFDRFNWPEN